MRKYMEVFRLSFKMQIIWRFDAAVTMLATVCRVLFAWILWRAVLEGGATAGGLTFETMFSYYVVSSIISSIDFSNQISGEISYLIRGGRFSGHMVTPINPFGFFGAMTAGESAFHLGFSLIAAAICASIFSVGVAFTTDIVKIALALLMIPTGLLFMMAYHYWIGMLTFRFLEINFFLHVQESVILLVTGSLIPLSLLPESMQSVLRFVPFSHVVYSPAMLLTGQMTGMEGLFSLFIILIGAIAMLFIAQNTYTRLRVKYDGVGI